MTSNEHELQLASAAESCHEAVALPKAALHFDGSGYTSLIALSSDWYWEQDSDFRFTKMVRSPCAAPLPGFIKSVPIGHRRWEMTGARALSETWDRHRARLEARQPFRDFEYAVFFAPYGLLTLSSSGEPVFDAQGRLAGYRGTTRDIPTKQVSELRLADQQAASSGDIVGVRGVLQDITGSTQADKKSSEHLTFRLSLTLQAMKDGFFALDREWRFTYVNPEAERVLCRPAGQLLGRTIWHEFPEAVGTNFQKQYERALLENVPVAFREFFAPLKLWVQVRGYPDPEGLMVLFSDVTEKVRAQQEMVLLNADLARKVTVRTAELEALTKEMETFSYSVAHDLRSPLAAISGFGKMLEKEFGPFVSERGRHLLSRIRAAAGQMEQMTEGLLALARVSPVEMRPRSVDLGQIAAGLVDRLRERDPDRKVDVHVMQDLWARGDAVLLTQALSNLLSNAWKFTGKQPQARIEVGSQTSPDGQPVYFVKDNGAGFDMNYASRLFGVFSRLHTTSEFEGTGIGLAIVKKVIERHAGRIWAEAVPDQGASFYFTLNADDCRAASVAEASGPPGCEPG